MALLAGKLYDPAAAVAKSTAAALAMTALDTTNLRLAFTVPANGAVLVRMNAAVTPGSAAPWFPGIHLGVLEGATVKGRQSVNGMLNSAVLSAAAPFMGVEVLFLVTGLTAGASLTWDAAYGVDIIATGSNLRYGGPNDATASNAYGGFAYEIWST